MPDKLETSAPHLPTRRDVVRGALKTMFVASTARFASAAAPVVRSMRSINIVNFIRADEPRERMDLITPVREQMALIKAHGFPSTWLLQYDALTESPFVDFLKTEMPANHEVGLWFEMNHDICRDAGVAWRGRPDWEWDYHVPIAYPIGYTPEERRKLIDTAAATFKRVFGHDVKSVASWNLDAVTTSHFSDRYHVDAFANCRDQLNTDGFTIWGAPIAGYYPNRNNAWSPALDAKNQIATPMFRMLGQDPVYYYDNQIHYPDTMEPVWRSGQSEKFVDTFFDMIAKAPTQAFAYAQLGQENSFGWPAMKKAYPMQLDKLAELSRSGQVTVETMGATGRRFKRAFRSTPTQAQIMLEDPYGNTQLPQRTVWYQSKFLRANLHFRGDQFYLRDLHVYNDQFPQPYLTEPVRQHGIEQRLLAVLDGFHWSDDAIHVGHDGQRAMARFVLIGPDDKETPLTTTALPKISEIGQTLRAAVPLSIGGMLLSVFSEREIAFSVTDTPPNAKLALTFEWSKDKTAFQAVTDNRLKYRFQDFDYSIQIAGGTASVSNKGVKVIASGKSPLKLIMAQTGLTPAGEKHS